MAYFTRNDDHHSASTVTVRGEFDCADEVPAWRAIGSVIDERRDLLIDLSDCEFIDARGLHVLVRGYREARDRGLLYAVAARSTQVRRVLEITGITRELPWFPSRGAALAYLSGDLESADLAR
jgi:anti-sigma B factor antagonist